MRGVVKLGRTIAIGRRGVIEGRKTSDGWFFLFGRFKLNQLTRVKGIPNLPGPIRWTQRHGEGVNTHQSLGVSDVGFL